jgi:hypothetical protein
MTCHAAAGEDDIADGVQDLLVGELDAAVSTVGPSAILLKVEECAFSKTGLRPYCRCKKHIEAKSGLRESAGRVS